MPIRITLSDGPQAGRVFEFPDGQPSVTLGRHPSCDVVFPAEQIAVSRYHLSFERKLARYRLVMQADNPVFVDGEDAFEGDELPLAAVVTLGRKDGPALTVETIEDDDLPPTERYARHASPARVAEAAGRRAAETRRVVWLLALLVIATLGLVGWFGIEERREVTRLVEEAYRGQPPQATEEQLAQRLREASRSVYLVAAKDDYGITPFGTAFVVGKGILATNAHVADVFSDMGSGRNGKGGVHMVARSSGATSHDFRVTRVQIHPHYKRFEDAWRAYGPMNSGAGGESRQITEAGGYDVALLYIDERDADLLADPLPIAPDADLLALEPGDAVGYVGFPVESAAMGGVNLYDPQAQIQLGRLTALTDFFLVKSEPSDRQLLQHSLPVQGGASGSPVLDRRGRVVGVLSGGNLVEIDDFGTRVPSGIGVNFAQRADLVREVLAGEVGERTAAREAYWERRLRKYQTEVDLQLQDWAASHGADQPPRPLLQVDGRTRHDPQFEFPIFSTTYTTPRAGWYLFLATARKRENIDMMVIEDAPKGPKLVGLDASPDHYPGVEYAGEKGTGLKIIVPGPTDTDVLLRVYFLPGTAK